MRRAVAGVSAAVLSIGMLAAVPIVASAAGEEIQVSLSQTTGAAPFDSDDLPGHDSSGENSIVRTNDNITYNVLLTVNAAAATNTTFTLTLPKGVELNTIPAFCEQVAPADPLSSITPETLPAATLPLTATSWESLPQQTLVCNVGDRTANSSLTYPVVAKVRGEVPNGAELTANVTAQSDDVTEPVTAEPVTAIVSARAHYDISKNSIARDESTGYVEFATVDCPEPHLGEKCYRTIYPILISTTAGGKGNSPVAGDITFTDDVSPEAFFPAGYDTKQPWIDAGADAVSKYGAILAGCDTNLIRFNPGAKIGSNYDATNAVRNTGTITCTQPGGPGTPISVTVSNTDTTAATCPTKSGNDVALPADRCYVAAGRISIVTPVATIVDLGAAPTADEWSMRTHNGFTDLSLVDLGGNTNNDGANVPENDYRDYMMRVLVRGTFLKAFAGVVGDPLNTPDKQYHAGYPFSYGPPGGATRHSGNIIVLPGQVLVATLLVQNAGTALERPTTAAMCDSWDPTKLHLHAQDYPGAGSVPLSQRYGSDGAAVWLSGGNTPADAVRIEYSSGSFGPGAEGSCDTGTWYSSPDQVPGNDPALAAQGTFTAVNKVRVYTKFPSTPTPNQAVSSNFFSIGFKVADSPIGTIVPNYMSTKYSPTDISFEELDEMMDWDGSTYNADDNSGLRGDRLTVSSAYARISKQVKGPFDDDFGTGIPQATGGQTVTWRLNPSLNSGVTVNLQQDVHVEDCLPPQLSYVSSSLAPTTALVVDNNLPADAQIACANGHTYIHWLVPRVGINEPIAPIELATRVKVGVSPGTFTNHTQVWTPGDQSLESQRQAQAQFQLVQPSGIYVDKVALTPVVQVNRADATILEPQSWEIVLANISIGPGPSDADIIDVLPENGARGSDYAGQIKLTGVTVTEGSTDDQPVQVLYTSAPVVSHDPTDASNHKTTGTTVWCDAATGGNPVFPASAAASSCPTSFDDVTGLRFFREGPFGPGAIIRAQIDAQSSASAGANLHSNRVAGYAEEYNMVGPVDAPELVISSSLGDYVWDDLNRNGLQDDGEPAVPGVTVKLSGTDDLGNTLNLSTVTDADGKYIFSDLRSGTYTVTFDKTTLPEGSHFTFQNVADGTPLIDSDGDVVTGVVTYELGQNEHYFDLDQGIFTMKPAITIQKFVNGQAAPEAPGVAVPQGSTMNFTFVVKNTGDTALSGVTVTDDHVTNIECPASELAIDAEMTCTGTAPAPEPGTQHTNTATVVGIPPTYPDGTELPPVTDSDSANAHTFEAKISIVKYAADADPGSPTGTTADGQDSDSKTAPGVELKPGEVTYSYLVTNEGSAELTSVTVTDDKLGEVSCPKAVLAVGESMVCLAKTTLGVGHVVNTGTVVGTPPSVVNPDGTTTEPDPVTASDVANVNVKEFPKPEPTPEPTPQPTPTPTVKPLPATGVSGNAAGMIAALALASVALGGLLQVHVTGRRR